MGKGVVCPFFSNYLFATSRCIEKEAVDKMIAHFVTAPSFYMNFSIIISFTPFKKAIALALIISVSTALAG